MAKHIEELREAIRKILEQTTALSETGISSAPDQFDSKKCTWELFEEFGLQILNEIGYQGDLRVIETVRNKFEDEGWNFDDM